MTSARRLQDRIRSLSQQVLEAEGEEFYRLAAELRAALKEHIERMRTKLGDFPKTRNRRSSDN